MRKAVLAILLLMSSAAVYGQITKLSEFTNFLVNSGIPVSDNKIDCSAQVPIRRVKLDIGLSYSANMAQKWLTTDPDLLVFGFEPDLSSVRKIKNGLVKPNKDEPEFMDIKYVKNGQFQIIPCALGSKRSVSPLFITPGHGCSSLYVPIEFEVESCEAVPVYTLKDFFDVFPWDKIPYIEYIKTDAQGSDLDILKGAGEYLRERVVYITTEPENHRYRGTNNSFQAIDDFMRKNGFIRVFNQETEDPTYLNKKFMDHPSLPSIKCYQQG